LAERKEAIRLHLYEGKSKAETCRRMGRSRPWLDRWLVRYDPDDVDGSLDSGAPGPEAGATSYSPQTHDLVVAMRQERSRDDRHPYALCGAAAIHYELKALDSAEVPSVRTIHRWLKEAGLIAPSTSTQEEEQSKPIPLPQAEGVNDVHQLDLKGPLYLRGSSQKHYLIVLHDSYSRRCALDIATSRKAQGIVDFLVATWQWMGLSKFLQMDNALEFRGSNRYPRSFGKVVRVALDVGVDPVFIPLSEPWRNGCVERFNGFLEQRLLAVECADLAALRAETEACQAARNQTHRLSALEGQTPDEVTDPADVRLLAANYQRHQRNSLPQDKGVVSFVRQVRKSGRITLGAGDRFMVSPELAYSYVLAQVYLDEQIVAISHTQDPLFVYPFTPHSVDVWAMDDTPYSISYV
jgi:transposase-like protein